MTISLLLVIITILLIGIALTTWKMFQFRKRLHFYISNRNWEKTLSEMSMYSEKKILLFGDSQVELWGMCPFFGINPFINRGVSGEEASEAKNRFNTELDNINPQIAVIITGANDLSHGKGYQQIAKDIETMILMAKRYSIYTIVGSLLPFGKGVYEDSRLVEMNHLNKTIKLLAEKNGAKYLDFYSDLADTNGCFRADLTNDGQHPNFNGYFKMSKLLLKSLNNYF